MISWAGASSDRGSVRPIAFEERQRTGSTSGRFRDREGDALRLDLSVGYDGAVIAYQVPLGLGRIVISAQPCKEPRTFRSAVVEFDKNLAIARCPAPKQT